MTDGIRERIFIPVRVPLYKGLFGIRTLLVNKNKLNDLKFLTSIEDLKKVTFTQGSEWPDTQILKSNGFSIYELQKKEDMIASLQTGKALLYPRSIAEINYEMEENATAELAILPNIYLYYPTAIYFFVQRTKEGKHLADRLEFGLNEAINDGTFDQLFNKSMSKIITKAELDNKRMIKLNNLILPELTPINESKYWFIKE